MNEEYVVIEKFFKESNGIIKTSEFIKEGFHNTILSKLENDGKILKIKHGYYQWLEDIEVSDAAIICKLFLDSVIYLESALYLYDYIDRTPNYWNLAFHRDSAKSRFNIKYPKIRLYFISGKHLELGKTIIGYENVELKIFDRDRTICDAIRYSNKIEKEILNQSIQSYIKDSKKNISKLMKYANELRMQEKVKMLVGVWL